MNSLPDAPAEPIAEPARNTIKVLMFMPHLSVGGGVVAYTQALLRYLAPRFAVQPFFIGVRPGRFGRLARLIIPFVDAFRLFRLSMGRSFDIYHLNPSLVPRAVLRDGMFLLILHLLRRRRILVFFHGWDDAYCSRVLANPIKRLAFRRIYGAATLCFVLAPQFASRLEDLGVSRTKIRVTTTMFDGRFIQKQSTPRGGQTLRILFLSRFISEKGLFELLSAFEILVKKHSGLTLILAGDGPEMENTKAWCLAHGLGDKVEFPGYVNGYEKSELLSNSDIFVLPSYREGCPISLLEAMASGLPAVVTRTGSMPDIVQDGKNGIVIDHPDVSLIVESLSQLILNRELCRRMGDQNRRDAWQNYDARGVTEKVEREYVALLPHTAI